MADKIDWRFQLPQIVHPPFGCLILHSTSQPYVVGNGMCREIFIHPFRTFGQDLERMLRTFQDDSHHLINKTERKKRIRSTGKKIYRVFSKLSVAAVIALMLFTSASAAFPSVRAATLNLLIQVSDVATELTFANESNEPSVTSIPSDSALYADMDIAGYVLPDSITSNYELTDKGSDQAGSWVLFKGADDALITFEVQHGKGNAVNINTENAVTSETINISQFQSVISQQDKDFVLGSIADSSKINFILVTFEGVDFESSLVMIEDFLNENLEGTK